MILNLTQHNATVEQQQAGVVDASPAVRAYVQSLLTFDECPTWEEVQTRARILAQLAGGDSIRATAAAVEDGVEPIGPHQYARAMIGGAPYLMAPLVSELYEWGITPVFAFSERISEEQVQPDGTVRKVNIFRHAGWVEG